jgi:aspartate kinase
MAIVMKFGGTSVGKPERMKKIAGLATEKAGKKIVVLSALSGTTNALVSIGILLLNKNVRKVEEEIISLERHYINFVSELYNSESYHAIGQEIVSRFFIIIRLLAAGEFDDKSYRELLAQGELIATELFYQHLQEVNIPSQLLPALDFMSIDANEEPELEKISSRLMPLINSGFETDLIVTQGYICLNHNHEIDT